MKEIIKMPKCDTAIFDQEIVGYFKDLCIVKNEIGFFFTDAALGHMVQEDDGVILNDDLTSISELPQATQEDFINQKVDAAVDHAMHTFYVYQPIIDTYVESGLDPARHQPQPIPLRNNIKQKENDLER